MRKILVFVMLVLFISSHAQAWSRTFAFRYAGQGFSISISEQDAYMKNCAELIKNWQIEKGSLADVPDRTLAGYLDFPCANPLLDNLATKLDDLSKKYFISKRDRLQFLISFVNFIPYGTDMNPDYWQVPFETVNWGSGDCEDHAFLLTDLMRRSGFDALIVSLPGHMACGADTNDLDTQFESPNYIIFNDHKYFYCEATGPVDRTGFEGFEIGESGIGEVCKPVDQALIKQLRMHASKANSVHSKPNTKK